MAAAHIDGFLADSAIKEKLSVSTQNQALSLLPFVYHHVIDREAGDPGSVIRAREPKQLPPVMMREEVRAVLSDCSGDKWLMVSLIDGASLYLMECLRLGVQGIDFKRSKIAISDIRASGTVELCFQSRSDSPFLTIYERTRQSMNETCATVRAMLGCWDALEREYSNAAIDWRWQWVFPREKRWKDSKTGEEGRQYVHEAILELAVKQAVRKAGVVMHIGYHTFGHSFATHLLEAGYKIRTMQGPLVYKCLSTTMIYTRVFNIGGHGVQNPIDGL